MDVIKILHDYGLYLQPKHNVKKLAPQFHTMYSVISKNMTRKETTFDEDLENLTNPKYNYFSTHYKSLLSATAVLNLKRLNITPSLFFIFLTFYNQWLQERVFDRKEAIVRGGIYAEAKKPRVSNNPLDNLKFDTQAAECDEQTKTPSECNRFASSISDFALVDTENKWTSVYKFAMLFFERDNAMTPSTHNNTDLKKYMKKNKYNNDPIIDLSRHAQEVDQLESERQSSTEKKKIPRKRRTQTQSNTGETPPVNKTRNVRQHAPPSASPITSPQTTEACEETESDDIKTAFATFCNNFDWKKQTQEIVTQEFKKKLSDLYQTVTGFPLSQDTPVNTTSNDFLKQDNIIEKDKDLQWTAERWLADYGNQIIDDYEPFIRYVQLTECDELSEEIIKQLFGAKNMLYKMTADGWLVLKVNNNDAVYKLLNSKEVDTFAPPWAKAALEFLQKAQENDWVLNQILDDHPTNEYIVLCTRKLYQEMMNLNNGIPFDDDNNGKSVGEDIKQDGHTSDVNKDDTNDEDKGETSAGVKPAAKRLFPTASSPRKSNNTASSPRKSPERTAGIKSNNFKYPA